MAPHSAMIVLPVRPANGGSPARWGVEFSRQGDRLSHSFFTEDPLDRRIVMRSVEGTDAERWPASAALQQMDSWAASARRQSLAGVGSAGTTHWSLAVEEDDQGCLVFDVACRVKEPFTFLGSTYEVIALAGRVECRRNAVAWRMPDRRAFFVDAWDSASQVHWDEASRRLTIRPASAASIWPATIRWKYRIGYGTSGSA